MRSIPTWYVPRCWRRCCPQTSVFPPASLIRSRRRTAPMMSPATSVTPSRSRPGCYAACARSRSTDGCRTMRCLVSHRPDEQGRHVVCVRDCAGLRPGPAGRRDNHVGWQHSDADGLTFGNKRQHDCVRRLARRQRPGPSSVSCATNGVGARGTMMPHMTTAAVDQAHRGYAVHDEQSAPTTGR